MLGSHWSRERVCVSCSSRKVKCLCQPRTAKGKLKFEEFFCLSGLGLEPLEWFLWGTP